MTANLVNVKAERECLAYAMQGYARDVVATLTSTDIDDERHAAVFMAIRDVLDANLEVTPVSVSECLKRRSDFETAGGITYLEKLSEQKVYNLDVALGAVKEFSVKRRLNDEVARILEMISNGTADSQKLTSLLFDAAMNTSGGDVEESMAMSEVSDVWLSEIEQIQQGVPMGYSSFIPSIDAAIGGIRPGELIGITGAPGRGKSLWLLLILLKNALERSAIGKIPVPSCLYSLEMGKTQVFNRAAVMESEILNLRQLRGGPGIPLLNKEQMREVKRIKTLLQNSSMFIGDRFDDIDKILADARRRIKRDGVKIIGIDYAQLLLQGVGMNEAGELSKISRKCRMFSQKEGVAVILLLKMKQSQSTSAL